MTRRSSFHSVFSWVASIAASLALSQIALAAASPSSSRTPAECLGSSVRDVGPYSLLRPEASDDDRDNDGIPNDAEEALAAAFQPDFLYGATDELVGPEQLNTQWCHFEEFPARHAWGLLGYDVVSLGFSNFFAIHYSLFLDRDAGVSNIAEHYFDTEGFTILVEYDLKLCSRCSPDDLSDEELAACRVSRDQCVDDTVPATTGEFLSVLPMSHHNTGDQAVDRSYYDERDNFYCSAHGLLAARNKHGIYTHYMFCETQIDYGPILGNDWEDCGENPGGVTNWMPHVSLSPYTDEGCDCDPTASHANYLACLYSSDHRTPACWEDLFEVSSARTSANFGFCQPLADKEIQHVSLIDEQKRFAPFVPLEMTPPEGVAYVDLFQRSQFTPSPSHVACNARDNFGALAVDHGLPLRLIAFQNDEWWNEFYSVRRNTATRPENPGKFIRGRPGLWNNVHAYGYWTPECLGDQVSFAENVRSLRLTGLPGTILAVYDLEEYVDTSGPHRELFFLRNYTIDDDDRVVEDADCTDISSMEFVTWGFGPLADAGEDQQVECGMPVSLDARGSYRYAPPLTAIRDNFELPPGFSYESGWTFKWTDDSTGAVHDGSVVDLPDPLPIGDYGFSLEVRGPRFARPDTPAVSAMTTVGDSTLIKVRDSKPPLLTCPQSITVECSRLGGTPASDPEILAFLQGAEVTDACEGALNAANDAPTFFSLGTTAVTFTAMDSSGNAGSCTSEVVVRDTTPPEVTVALSPSILWPPNHKLVGVQARVAAYDVCSVPTIELASVSSDESSTRGAGHTSPDIEGAELGTADFDFRLRAERAGTGDGRSYSVSYKATDGSRNSSSRSAAVSVPH